MTTAQYDDRVELVASWPSQMNLAGVADWATRIESLGFDTIHVPETIHDPFTVAALALNATHSITVRTSMVVAFARSPMLTAYAAWDLAKFSAGRFQLGVASQVKGNIVGRFSVEWTEPAPRLADYIRAVRAIFASFETGESLDYSGTHYQFNRLQPYFNPGPLGHAPPTIWTGGVNRRMCELAGEVADGFVCHPTNSHPKVLSSSILPALAVGATAAGRSTGPQVIAGPQPIMAASRSLLGPAAEARRSELAFLYSTPAYRGQLEHFGLEDIGVALSDMARRADWTDLGEHLSDEVMRVVVPQGTYNEIPDVLEQWYAGLCSGIALAVPEHRDDDDALRTLVARCQRITPAPTESGHL